MHTCAHARAQLGAHTKPNNAQSTSPFAGAVQSLVAKLFLLRKLSLNAGLASVPDVCAAIAAAQVRPKNEKMLDVG